MLQRNRADQSMTAEFAALLTTHPLPDITVQTIKYDTYYTTQTEAPDLGRAVPVISGGAARATGVDYWSLHFPRCQMVSSSGTHRMMEKTTAWALRSGLFLSDERYGHPAPGQRYVTSERNLGLALRRSALWLRETGTSGEDLLDMAAAADDLRNQRRARQISAADYHAQIGTLYHDASEIVGPLFTRQVRAQPGQMVQTMMPSLKLTVPEAPSAVWCALMGYDGIWWGHLKRGVILRCAPTAWSATFHRAHQSRRHPAKQTGPATRPVSSNMDAVQVDEKEQTLGAA